MPNYIVALQREEIVKCSTELEITADSPEAAAQLAEGTYVYDEDWKEDMREFSETKVTEVYIGASHATDHPNTVEPEQLQLGITA